MSPPYPQEVARERQPLVCPSCVREEQVRLGGWVLIDDFEEALQSEVGADVLRGAKKGG